MNSFFRFPACLFIFVLTLFAPRSGMAGQSRPKGLPAKYGVGVTAVLYLLKTYAAKKTPWSANLDASSNLYKRGSWADLRNLHIAQVDRSFLSSKDGLNRRGSFAYVEVQKVKRRSRRRASVTAYLCTSWDDPPSNMGAVILWEANADVELVWGKLGWKVDKGRSTITHGE